jgi:NAD(P)-dependent dehydrogenase (short-subunit alcohol dehydrogenase family)
MGSYVRDLPTENRGVGGSIPPLGTSLFLLTKAGILGLCCMGGGELVLGTRTLRGPVHKRFVASARPVRIPRAATRRSKLFTSAGATAYACSKPAQVALAKMAALELAPHRIRVNVVCPGMIETAIGDNTWERRTEAAAVPANYPAGRIPLTGGAPGRAEDVAELVLFLASERSRRITGTPV